VSLTSLLSDPKSPVRVYLDGISPRLEASRGRSDGSRAAAEALGLLELTKSRLVVSPFPEADLPRSGTAFDFRARIELGVFDPRHSKAAAGIAQLADYVPFVKNGPHRAKILTEAFGVAEVLLRQPFRHSDLDRAAILLAHCEQVDRAGPKALTGSVGASCDAAVDGQEFANNLDPLALADIRSLMLSNAAQLETWQEQIAGGDRYEPNPSFTGSDLVGGADGDWVIGETLVDSKVYGALTVPKLRDAVRQLLGYVMLDSDDSLGIRRVGIWLPRQRLTPTWSLTRLLGGDPEELLPSLRQGFIKATGKKQLAIHSPTSTKLRHEQLADNRHTPFEMLAKLALGEDVNVRRRVGRNAVAPEATVRMLAEDTRWQAREGVAMNEAAPDDVLEALARDRSIAVRRAVAANPGAPRSLVKDLAVDTDPDVQWAARANDGIGYALVSVGPLGTERSASVRRGGAQLRQDRGDSGLDSEWFAEFLRFTRGDGRLPIPTASYRWGYQSSRQLPTGEGMRTGLPHEVLRDLIRTERPEWIRRTVAGDLPISDPTVREGLLSDADPEIRWLTLKRTLRHPDESLSVLLAELAASREARLRFRTAGIGARRDWRHTAAEYDHQTLCLIASHPSTPYATLVTLMVDSSADVLASLVENPSLGADDRLSLIHFMQVSKSVTSRELLASLVSVPETVLIELASDRDVRVRVAVAKHPAAPLAALSRLAADSKRAVRLAVLESLGTPGDVASTIAEAMLLSDADQDLHTALILTKRRIDLDLPLRVTEGALDRLSKSRVRDPDMRVVVAGDQRSSSKTLSRLARSAERSVRQAVATNPHTPEVVLGQLASDIDPNVRTVVARNPECPAIVLVALSHDQDPHVRTQTAGNPNTPRSILETLLIDAEVGVRSAALENPATPADLVREARLELSLTIRTSCPDRAALEEMAANKRAEVRMDVAFSPTADADLLALLGGERRSAQVRRAVAANPNTPAAVLRSLADDKDNQVRQAVAFNGATPESLLTELAGRSIDLAILVAMNPEVPDAVLDALGRDSSPVVRYVANGTRQAHAIPSSLNTPRALEGRDLEEALMA
jgi:hypothetical protein